MKTSLVPEERLGRTWRELPLQIGMFTRDTLSVRGFSLAQQQGWGLKEHQLSYSGVKLVSAV